MSRHACSRPVNRPRRALARFSQRTRADSLVSRTRSAHGACNGFANAELAGMKKAPRVGMPGARRHMHITGWCRHQRHQWVQSQTLAKQTSQGRGACLTASGLPPPSHPTFTQALNAPTPIARSPPKSILQKPADPESYTMPPTTRASGKRAYSARESYDAQDVSAFGGEPRARSDPDSSPPQKVANYWEEEDESTIRVRHYHMGLGDNNLDHLPSESSFAPLSEASELTTPMPGGGEDMPNYLWCRKAEHEYRLSNETLSRPEVFEWPKPPREYLVHCKQLK